MFEMDEEMLLSCDIYKHFKQDFNCDDAEEVAIAEYALEAYLKALLGHLEQEPKKQLPSRKLAWRDASIKFVFSHPITWDQTTRKRFEKVIKRTGFGAPDDHSFEGAAAQAANWTRRTRKPWRQVSRRSSSRSAEWIATSERSITTAPAGNMASCRSRIFNLTSSSNVLSTTEKQKEAANSLSVRIGKDDYFKARFATQCEEIWALCKA